MALRAENSAHPSSSSHLVGLPVFWSDAAANPSMDWDKWFDLFQVAIMAKYSISITELTRNADQQHPRVRALLGDLDEDPANKKVISILYLSLGEPARKQFMDKYPHTALWDLKAQELINLCIECFRKKRNRTLDRHRFFSRHQQQGESLSQFWHALNGLAALCDFGEITPTLVLDMFILHMNNKKVQEKLCTEPKEPEQALEFALAYEEGIQRQKAYGTQAPESSKPAIKSEPVYAVEKTNPRECYRCGAGNFTMDHVNFCMATNHRCKFCQLMGHLEKCCNKKFPHRQKEMLKRLKSQDNKKGMRRVNYIEESDEESEDDEDEEQLVLRVDGDGCKPFYMEGTMCGNYFKAIIDTGSPVSIFTKSDLQKIVGPRKVVIRDMIAGEKYVDYNKKPLNLLGYQFVRLEVAGVTVSKARVLVAPNSGKSIVGRDWLVALRYKIKQPIERGEYKINKQSVKCEESINEISPEKSLNPEVQQLVGEFPNLFKRKGRVKNYEIKIKMKDDVRISQQKGRRIPIQLQNQVDDEIEKLLKEGHIEKVDKIQDDVFIQPTVITVKKDKSVKIALDARALNQSIAKDKYQMPNLDNLIDMIAEKLDEKSGEAWYSSVDMTYAYGQIPLQELTKRHCNFQIVGGKSTGTYRFTTGFYGLTVMPTEFQKLMDLTLANVNSVFVYIDDVLIVTKGTKQEHLNKVREVMKILDEANLQLKAEKCIIAQDSIEWLGYKLTRTGISPVNAKAQGISERLRPNNLKQLRSFLGAVNQFNKFIPNLASISFPFRTILKKDAEWTWNEEHEKAFVKINDEIKRVVELSHFKRNKEIRIICDASKQGLGAVLQQSQETGEWKPICFASRFLTDFEAKYSINELELLAIVWAVEHFRNYVYGVQFKIVSDHKALASVLKPNRGNKTFSSRLTRWVDRLLPFDFQVVNVAGRMLGMADYLSRHPTELNGSTVKAETLWNEWFTVNSVISLNNVLDCSEASSERSKPAENEESSINRINRVGRNQPIRLKNERNSRDSSKRHCGKSVQTRKMSQSPSIKLLNEKLLPANYCADKLIQRVIKLVKKYNKTGVTRLPSPWREKFQTFSIDERGFLYTDNRLVIPQAMRAMIMCSLHYGHPGRDAMLSMIEDIWWPRIHREVIDQARLCEQCLQSGKNLKNMLTQKQVGKLPDVTESNEEVALDFAGPFQNARKGKKYLLVSIDHFSGWPDAKFLHRPTTKKVIEFLKQYCAQYGVPKKIRTDPGTVFISEQFKQFCKQFGIEQVMCPIRDHRGNGKIERLIRTINERLRANKNIVLTKDKTGLSEILYSLRISKKKDGKSPFEKQMGKAPNTVKSNLVQRYLDFSAQDNRLDFQQNDFQDECDSTILVRERAKGSKLEPVFAKKTGRIVESEHTITVLPEGAKQGKVFSKRDVVQASKEQKKKFKKAGKRAIIEDSSSSSESEGTTKRKGKKAKQEKASPRGLSVKWEKLPTQDLAFDLETEKQPSIIDISSTTDSKGSTDEVPPPKQEVAKTAEKEESETIPIKATSSWQMEKKVPTRSSERKHVPPKRYGIDLISREKEVPEEEATN